MDGRVLAHLERGEVEPERRELPAEVGELAVRDAPEPVRRERVLDDGQLRVERLGVAVAAGARRGLAGQRRPGAPDPLRDRAQPLPVRLLGEAAVELAHRLGQLLPVLRERMVERPVDGVRRDAGGDRLHQPQGDGLVAAEQVVRLEPRGVHRDVARDARVAVAVGADPRPEAEQRRREDRVGARAARIGGVRGARVRAGGTTARAAPARPVAGRVERPVDRALEAGHDREQRLVEDRERGPDLVERRRHDRAQPGGVPQDRDLLAEPAPQVRVLVGRRERVIELVEQAPDPAQRDEQRPPAGLGGVRGEHRVDMDGRDERPDAIGTVDRQQPGDRVGDGIVDRPAAGGTGSGAQDADPLPLLGEVDELEVERERLGDGRGLVEVQRGDLVGEPRALRVRRRDDRRIATAQGDRAPPDALDELEQLRAGLFGDHLAEQRAEQADLARERVAGTAEAGARRLGRDGGEPRARRRSGGPAGPGGILGHGVRMRERHDGCQPPRVTVRLQGHRARYHPATDFGSGDA